VFVDDDARQAKAFGGLTNLGWHVGDLSDLLNAQFDPDPDDPEDCNRYDKRAGGLSVSLSGEPAVAGYATQSCPPATSGTCSRWTGAGRAGRAWNTMLPIRADQIRQHLGMRRQAEPRRSSSQEHLGHGGTRR
jgi:hypothetical protein